MISKGIIETTWGYLPNFKWKNKDEACSACPTCGGDDRFFMRYDDPGPRGYCRECRKTYWPDDGNHKLTEEERLAIAREARINKALEKRKQDKIKLNIEQFMQVKPWEKLHASMNKLQSELWQEHGITPSMQEYYQLGYEKDRSFWNYETKSYIKTDVLTIPQWHYNKTVDNIQFRLLSIPENFGKYRTIKGFPINLFFGHPDRAISGRIILVEGSKKCMIVQNAIDSVGYDALVISVPSKEPSPYLLNQLDAAEEVVIALDPDAYKNTGNSDSAVVRAAKIINTSIKIARFPIKPDDFIVQYGATPSQFASYLELARTIK